MIDETGQPVMPLEAATEPLRAADQTMIGVTLVPNPQGWTLGYMRGMGPGGLASADSLADAACAPIRPLFDVAERLEENRRAREP